MVTLGSGAERSIEDLMLTRYGCYLIAQNGDPRKEPIAFAQSYFAIQTRKQELIEERMRLQTRLEIREKLRGSQKTLSQNIYERGVDDAGFARIRSRGDTALFGGHSTQAMKDKYGITQSRPLKDNNPKNEPKLRIRIIKTTYFHCRIQLKRTPGARFELGAQWINSPGTALPSIVLNHL